MPIAGGIFTQTPSSLYKILKGQDIDITQANSTASSIVDTSLFIVDDPKACAFDDYNGTVSGTVRATASSHGLYTGLRVQVVSTPAGSWTGEKQITKIDSNTFYFTGSFGSGDTAGYYNGAATTTKKVTPVTLAAYLDDEITAMPNLVSTGALDSGSITANFGSINNGSSTITTTGAIAGGSFTIGGHSIADIDIGSEFNDVDDHLMTSGAIKDKIELYNYFPASGGTIVGNIAVIDNSAAQLIAGYDINNKCTLSVIEKGVTTISTIGAGTNDSDLTLDVDGDIELNADGGTIIFKDDTTTLANIDSSGNLLIIGALTARGNTHSIGTAGNTTATSYGPITNTHDTAGKALTISGGSTTAGTTDNIAGGTLTLQGGQGKGTGVGGAVIFKMANAGSSGSSLNALAEKMRIHTNGYVGIGVADPDAMLEIFGTSTQLKLAHNENDYATFAVADTGDLTIATVGDGATDSDIKLQCDGSIYLESAAAKYYLSIGGSNYHEFGYNTYKLMNTISDDDDYFEINIGPNGATALETVEDSGNMQAELSLRPQGNVNLQAADGKSTRILPDMKTASSIDDKTLECLETLNLSSGAGGSDVHYGIKYTQVQTDLTGWDNVYLMYLDGGSGKLLHIDNNANLTLSDDRKVIFGNAGEYITGDGTDLDIVSSNHVMVDAGGDITLDAAGRNVFIAENGTNKFKYDTYLNTFEIFSTANASDIFKIDVDVEGATTLSTTDADTTVGHLTLDADGAIISDSHSGKFLAKKAGTEFSAANSSYAGMILGYTRIANDGTGPSDYIIQVNSSSMTVLQTVDGTDLSIQFIVPPSGNVEIQCSFWMSAFSDGAKFSLSTDASYAELGITHTYDADQTIYIDETDHNYNTISFSVTGLTAGTDTTYYLAGLASGAGVIINHGRFRLGGTHFPPIIMKAIALPATIVTGE